MFNIIITEKASLITYIASINLWLADDGLVIHNHHIRGLAPYAPVKPPHASANSIIARVTKKHKNRL